MCLIVFNWQPNADRMLTLASNRDEFYARPSKSAHYWNDSPNIFGGRDLKMQGTWLAVSRSMRFAAVTNFRSPNKQSYPRSRGEIPHHFLSTNLSAIHFAQQISLEDYAGFNALLFDGKSLVYCHNQKNSLGEYVLPIELAAGNYGLSNHLLDTPWPKVERTKNALSRIEYEAIKYDKTDIAQKLLFALKNDEKAADHLLPNTGIKLEFERALSSAFISLPDYGTRTSTIVIIERTTGNSSRHSSIPVKQIYFHERQYHTQHNKFEDNTYTINPLDNQA